jgi:DNA-binding protein YbaB
MATPTKAKTQRIRPLENYTKLSDQDVVSLSTAVGAGMTGNTHFTTLPVDLTVLKTNTETFNELISQAMDGSKKVISEKNKQRQVVIKMLKLLARYVEIMSDNDPAVFNTSGFPAASTTKAPPQLLPVPAITKVTHGSTGQLLVVVKGKKKAKSYDLRYAPIVNGQPSNWIEKTLSNVRSPIPFDGLTPGTTYAFQARAYGTAGYTAWTDSTTCMCA